jgi:hypothetical protein
VVVHQVMVDTDNFLAVVVRADKAHIMVIA